MSRIIPFILLIFTLAIGLPVMAQSGDPPPPEPLTLTDEHAEYPLGLHLEILEDPSGELTIGQVSSPEYDSQFIPSQVKVPNYGFTDSAYRARLTLDNQTRQLTEWLLEVGFANTHYVDLYTPMPGGESFTVKQTGTLRPTSTRDILNPHIVFVLSVLNDDQIGEGRLDHTIPVGPTSSAGMDIGRDNGLVVDLDYEELAPYAFTGKIKQVVFDLKPHMLEDEQALHEHEMIHAVAAGVAG